MTQRKRGRGNEKKRVAKKQVQRNVETKKRGKNHKSEERMETSDAKRVHERREERKKQHW